MNLAALKEILDNHDHLLRESANDESVDEETIMGISRDAAANGYEQLSDNQQYRFNQCIRHLIEDINCQGYRGPFGEDDPTCQNTLNDDDLVEHYQEDDFLCEDCREEASYDQYSKDKFMQD